MTLRRALSIPGVRMGGDASIARIVELAAGARSEIELRLGVLAELRDAVGFDGALYRPGDRWTGARTTYLDVGLRFTDVYQQDPVRYREELAAWCTLSRGREPFLYEDLYGAQARARTLTYNEVLRPSRVRSLMGAPLAFAGRTVGLLLLYRRGPGRAFSADTLARVSRLLPAVALAEASRAVAAKSGTPAGEDPLLARFHALPAREKQVAALLARGLASKEIAALLGTSFHTVRKQIVHVFDRLGVHDRARLAVALQPVCGER